MNRRVHRGLLAVYRRLPRRARLAAVHLLAPSFSVGAVCLVEHDSQLLLVRHAYRRGWGAPGGLLERGEQPDRAAVREVREEAGVTVELLGPPESVVDPRTRRVDLVFRARLPSGIVPSAATAVSPEIVEVRWFPNDNLPPLQPETAGALFAVARRSIPQH